VPTFEHNIVVRAPQVWLFDLMQDYGRRLEWDPFLGEARLVEAEAAGLGVRAFCVDRAGRGMETEYVSFQRPERVAVKMTRGPWMFRSFAGSWRYEALDAESTRVTFRYHVEARLRALTLRDRLEAIWATEREAEARATARR
jgi:ribosome-associated toxin RatA of RatAB toxin-antitoxin module